MVRAEIYWLSDLDRVRFAVMPRPRGEEWLLDEVRSWRLAGVNRVISLLESHESQELGLEQEAALCAENDLNFTSFPIPDRGVPESMHKAAMLVQSIESDLLSGKGVAVHCRAGVGRSGLIAGGVLFHLGVPEPEVFPRISRCRGIKVPDTLAQEVWLANYARERKNVLYNS